AFFGAGSSPILEDGLLIVQVGAQPNSGVVAFDAATGKTVWENVGEKSWNGVPMTAWPGSRSVEWNRNDPRFEKQASYCTPVAARLGKGSSLRFHRAQRTRRAFPLRGTRDGRREMGSRRRLAERRPRKARRGRQTAGCLWPRLGDPRGWKTHRARRGGFART